MKFSSDFRSTDSNTAAILHIIAKVYKRDNIISDNSIQMKIFYIIHKI
jgi:hypothetical protein